MHTAQVVVVTGSTRGIGRGLAAEFLRRGHHVAISSRTAAAVDRALAELAPLAADGARVVGAACDVTHGDDLQRLWDTAVAAFGRVDHWINNAGVTNDRQRVGQLAAEDIRAVHETNLLGMMLATRVAMQGMRGQPGGGTVWNMEGYGSSGMMAPGMSQYGASKFALTYFNEALAAETKHGPVKVCHLSPGIVVTDLLRRDMGGNDPQQFERTKRVYNILGDRVETVTPFLVEGILKPHRSGDRVAWLTGPKAGGRFMMSMFRKRQLLTDADLA